ncbi:TPA: acetylxylan esterase [Streptococcus pneumoniae]|nr:acetylxylan esterase [Streptococcus pneumoniae]
MKNPALLEEIKTYRGRDEVPEDFDAFWDGEVKNVSTLPSYHLEERDFHIPQVKCYELTFEGSKEGKVYARIVLPKSEEKVPLIFHFHGYMGRGWDWADMLGQSGYSQDGLRSPLGNTVKGHIIRGAMEGRDHLFYKDVYLDIYQLVEIVASLSQVDEKRLSSYGASQGGALALVAAALNPRIQKTVAIYPFLSDFRRVIEIGNTSEAYDELFRYFKFHDPFHETEEEIMATLAYIDVKNLAHRIQGEVKMITGLDDDVCYPITQFAIYNRLTCDKTYRIMPEYAHEAMNVFVNDQVYNWLCGSEIPFKYLK